MLADPNLRPRAMARAGRGGRRASASWSRAADVLKCNEAEARELTGASHEREAIADASEPGARERSSSPPARAAHARALGARQSRRSPRRQRHVCVDATGAGDSVTGVGRGGLAAGASPDSLAAVVAVAMEAAAGVVGRGVRAPALPPAADARSALAAALTQ